MLWSKREPRRSTSLVGAAVMAVLLGGVLWSNILGYGDATLAPRARLAELQHIGTLVAGKGPTFINAYEIYADRHFLRAGAPVEPAEYRIPGLPLRDGAVLTKAAAADIDSFPLSTLEPYRSIVTPRMPAESRPPSMYKQVWQGTYYQLWQRPAQPQARVIEHVPLGESNSLPYCGNAQEGANRPLCSINPVATPACSEILMLARRAEREHARLVAYQRPAPIVARGDQTLWPGGSFSRGFHVTVDGRRVGGVKDELASIDEYVRVAKIFLTPGVHTFGLTYPRANLTPGSAENQLTSLDAIALEPEQSPASELISASPARASELCGRSLDWIEIVTAS
jgi:hypothetical protein